MHSTSSTSTSEERHDPPLKAMICQLNWKTLPGLRGLGCSEFRAAETAAPDNERGVAAEFSGEAARDTLLRQLENYFAGQRFSNNAAAFEAVKAYVLEHAMPLAAKREQA